MDDGLGCEPPWSRSDLEACAPFALDHPGTAITLFA
jgi:hypothetical protein